jgi:hypothetical protein
VVTWRITILISLVIFRGYGDDGNVVAFNNSRVTVKREFYWKSSVSFIRAFAVLETEDNSVTVRTVPVHPTPELIWFYLI